MERDGVLTIDARPEAGGVVATLTCRYVGCPYWLVRARRRATSISIEPYGLLFEDAWPNARVDDDWLPRRFNMALMCGPNYLHLRRAISADHPLALLHVRHLADERIGNGWNDRREAQPKTWATALGMLAQIALSLI